jgi:WD40 repeat protein
MVVPVKKLGHPDRVVDCQWHPTLPWVFTACTDGIVRLWA